MSTSSCKVGPVRVRPHTRAGKPTGKWFVDIPAALTGTGRRKRKLFDNRRTAIEVARELKRRVDPVTGTVLPPAQRSGLLLREAAAHWRTDQELRVATLKKRPISLKTQLHRVRVLLAWFGERDVAAIGERDIASYQRRRLEDGRRPATINSEVAVLDQVLGWAVREGYLREQPKAEQIPVRRAHVEIPTPEEMGRIIQELPERLKPLVWFLAETGCRKGEAVNLTWDCLDEIGGYAEVRAREGWTPKTQQSERRIPLSPALLKTLRALPKQGPYVFTGKVPGKPVTDLRKALRSATARAGIRRQGQPLDLTPKTLRKAHATWQAMRGVNESVLQGLLGHAAGSRVTKQYYVHATEEAKRAAVIRLPVGEQDPNR